VRHSTLAMRLITYISIVVFSLGLVSCDRIKNRGHAVALNAKGKMLEKRDAAADRLIPTFDSYKPDTKYNKKRFTDFFGFVPTDDVSDLYCFNDQIGIDSKFQFSFRCDTATKVRIIKYLELSPERTKNNSSSGLWTSFKWWDRGKIETLVPYSYKIENKYYRYLWFDDSTGTAYYLDFDM
jgi:hypothetical protein